jgi:hypothetical protein
VLFVTSPSAVNLSLRSATRAAVLQCAPPQRCHPAAERRDLRLFLPLLLETTGMVRRLNLLGGIRGEQEASHGNSHDRH